MPRAKRAKLQKSNSILSKTSRSPAILDLPLEIFYIITSELSRDDLKALRGVHKQLKALINPMLFGSIGIHVRSSAGGTKSARAEAIADSVDKMYRMFIELGNSEILTIPQRFYFLIDHYPQFYKYLNVGMGCLAKAFQTMFPRTMEMFSRIEVVEIQAHMEDFVVKDSVSFFKTIGDSLGSRRLSAKINGLTPNRALSLRCLRNLEELKLAFGDIVRVSAPFAKQIQQTINRSGSKLVKLELEKGNGELNKIFDGVDKESLSGLKTLTIVESGRRDCHISAQNLLKLPSLDTLTYSLGPHWLYYNSHRCTIWKELQLLGGAFKVRSLEVDGAHPDLLAYLAQAQSPQLQDLKLFMDPQQTGINARDESRPLAGTFFKLCLPRLQSSLRTLSYASRPIQDKWGLFLRNEELMDYYDCMKNFNFRPGAQPLRFSQLRSLRASLICYGSTDPAIVKCFENFMFAIRHSPNLQNIYLLVETLDFNKETEKTYTEGVNADDIFHQIDNFISDGTEWRAGLSLEVKVTQLIHSAWGPFTRWYVWDGHQWRLKRKENEGSEPN